MHRWVWLIFHRGIREYSLATDFLNGMMGTVLKFEPLFCGDPWMDVHGRSGSRSYDQRQFYKETRLPAQHRKDDPPVPELFCRFFVVLSHLVSNLRLSYTIQLKQQSKKVLQAMADPDKGAKKRLRAAARAALKRTKRTPAATDAQATTERINSPCLFLSTVGWYFWVPETVQIKSRLRRITYKNQMWWSCVIFLVDTVTLLLGVGVYSKNLSFRSLIGCSGSMDPPCLRSRNSWRIRSNWDSNARPDLLAVGVGCCRRKELLRGISNLSNLCMGWWGNAKFPDVFLILFTCASKNVCSQFSSCFGSECYPASLFLMTFARVPSIFDIWDSPTPLAQ